MLSEQEVINRLRLAVEQAGGQRAFAARHGFTPAYISDVLRRRRTLAERILAAIGVERSTVYRVIDSGIDSSTNKEAPDADTLKAS